MKLIERMLGAKALSVTGAARDLQISRSWMDGTGWGPQSRLEYGDENFESYVRDAYKASGVVFACVMARLLVFSEARFAWQRMQNGRPGDLFSTPELRIFEEPWPGEITGGMLARMEQDVSMAGNAFITRLPRNRLRRLRPDWVTIVTGSRSGDPNPAALDAEVVGYLYSPSGMSSPNDATLILPGKMAHYSPIPDPIAQWRGMSWITPVAREINGDVSASDHKLAYFRNGTVGGIAISYAPEIPPAEIERYAEAFEALHAGTDNAYGAFHFGGGADVTTLGADLKQLDFKVTQGAGETRIAAASGVGAVIAQLSEGLQGSSLNAGNFSAAKRRFADGTMRPLWRSAAGALASLVDVPAGSRLWYDVRDVAFLAEDQKEEAETLRENAATISALVDAGFDPDRVVEAVSSGDIRSLRGSHSGLYSVQLQQPGTTSQPKTVDTEDEDGEEDRGDDEDQERPGRDQE